MKEHGDQIGRYSLLIRDFDGEKGDEMSQMFENILTRLAKVELNEILKISYGRGTPNEKTNEKEAEKTAIAPAQAGASSRFNFIPSVWYARKQWHGMDKVDRDVVTNILQSQSTTIIANPGVWETYGNVLLHVIWLK